MDPARLKKLSLFDGLSDKDLQQIGRWADEVEVPAGKHLIDEGQFGYEFFVIEEGKAEVKRGDEVLANLGPGDFFGEIALTESDRRTASVVASEPLRTIVMTRRDFAEMQSEMPSVCTTIHRAIKERKDR